MRGVAEIIENTAYELVLYSVNDSNHEKDRSDIIDHILSTRWWQACWRSIRVIRAALEVATQAGNASSDVR